MSYIVPIIIGIFNLVTIWTEDIDTMAITPNQIKEVMGINSMFVAVVVCVIGFCFFPVIYLIRFCRFIGTKTETSIRKKTTDEEIINVLSRQIEYLNERIKIYEKYPELENTGLDGHFKVCEAMANGLYEMGKKETSCCPCEEYREENIPIIIEYGTVERYGRFINNPNNRFLSTRATGSSNGINTIIKFVTKIELEYLSSTYGAEFKEFPGFAGWVLTLNDDIFK